MAAALCGGAATVVAAACSGGGSPVLVTDLPPRVTSTMEVDVRVGAPIDTDSAAHFLPMLTDGWQARPVAAWGGKFLVSETEVHQEADSISQRFVLWDPVTGMREPAWETDAGWQDIVTGVDGGLAVTVRTGLELPFPEWRIDVRNLRTHETKTVAQSQAEVAEDPSVKVAPPFGFAPYPSVQGGRLAWAEYTRRDGVTNREVRLHDLRTGETKTLTIVTAASGENLASVTLGGDRAAWVRSAADGAPRIVVQDLTSGREMQPDYEARPYAVALDATGTTLAWDDARGGKYVTHLDGRAPERFAGDEGWGVVASGQWYTWAPAAAYGGTAGFFDVRRRELRLVERKDHVQVNYAAVLGQAFAWQELITDDNGTPDEGRSGYYFLPLDS